MLLSASTNRLWKDFSGNSENLFEQETRRKITEKKNIKFLIFMSIKSQSQNLLKLVLGILVVYYFLMIKYT